VVCVYIYKILLLAEVVGLLFETNTLALRKAGYTRNVIKGKKKRK